MGSKDRAQRGQALLRAAGRARPTNRLMT